MGKPPERLVVAVDTLEVRADDHILEIGCGRGMAAHLVCARLGEAGRLVAIDRSDRAIEAAVARNEAAIAAGKARFLNTELEQLDPAELGDYDKVFAVNVNAFWVKHAGHELTLIARLLRPGGKLYLCFDPPDVGRLDRLRATLAEQLSAAGYRHSTTSRELDGATQLTVVAEPGC